MASVVTLKTIGNWRKEIEIPLDTALAVSMDITGRTGEQACRHAMILMAHSARAKTRKSPKLRKIVKNPDERWKTDRRRAPFGVMVYRNGKEVFKPIFRTGEYGSIRFFDKKSASWFDRSGPNGNTWNKIASGADVANPELVVPGIKTDKRRNIGRSGLAKDSWLWSLSQLGGRGRAKHRPIAGVNTLRTITSPKVNGYVLTNKLRYITHKNAMPAGWQKMVEVSAANKIMAQARSKLEGKWRREMGMPGRQRKERQQDQAFLAAYFLQGLH